MTRIKTHDAHRRFPDRRAINPCGDYRVLEQWREKESRTARPSSNGDQRAEIAGEGNQVPKEIRRGTSRSGAKRTRRQSQNREGKAGAQGRRDKEARREADQTRAKAREICGQEGKLAAQERRQSQRQMFGENIR